MTHAHVIQFGSGPEPLFGLHCLLAYAQSLEPVIAEIDDLVTATLMDLPGHGASADWDEARSYGDQALEMALTRIPGRSHVIGHSYGAYLALRLAVEHPELVQTLTLIDPVFLAAAKAHDPDELATHLMRASATFRALSDGDDRRAAEYFMNYWGGERDITKLSPAVVQYSTERIQLVRATQPALLEDDAGLLDRLGSLPMPVLLIEGGDTPSVMRAICDHLEAEIPNTSRMMVDGAGHMAPITHPREIAAMVGSFVEANQLPISDRN